ncbi:MAG: SLC13 family permease [Halobacteriales archaeon]|nr:SLC13 family permease [Halobacteriales archaeon]
MDRGQLLGLLAAVGLAAAVASTPLAGLSPAGQHALAAMAFAGTLWVTGALPLPVTALLVPVALVGLDVVETLPAAFSGFADPVIFLMLAGFVLARALQKHGVDRRVAYWVLARLGSSPSRLVLAVMVTTAGLSMLVSNTATTAMMAPIALGVAGGVAPTEKATDANIGVAMLLGTAYAASLGGLGTLVGSPPNAIVAAQLEATIGYRVGFLGWMRVGLPIAVVSVPLTWLVLTRWLYPPQIADVSVARGKAATALEEAGSLDAAAKRVVLVAGATAALWVLGGLDFALAEVLPPAWFTTLFGGPGPTVLGTTGHLGLLHFSVVGLLAIPALVLSGGLEWEDAERIDWGTLVLLGGGLSLANGLAGTDATRWLADRTLALLGDAPVVLVVLGLLVLVVVVGELASNTAMAAIVAPLLITVGPRYATALGTTDAGASVFLAIAGGVAASVGFALPVATPPNAIVFGTGELTKDQMLRAGVVLDALMVLVMTGLLFVVVPR